MNLSTASSPTPLQRRIARETVFLSLPEGKEIVRELIASLRADLAHLGAYLRDITSKKATAKVEDDWFWELRKEKVKEEQKKLLSRIHTLEFKLSDAEGWEEIGQPKGFNLDAIRAVPISDILNERPMRKGGNRWYYKCIAHNEKTPSMVYYVDQNRVHCFGCGFSADVIGLVMAINNCDFKKACKILSHE